MALKKAARRKALAPEAAPLKYKPPKPEITLRGKHAERLFGGRVGQRVTAVVQGKIRHMSQDDYGPNGKPEKCVRMEVHRMHMKGGGRMKHDDDADE